MKRYVLAISGGIEADTYGPFATEEERYQEGRRIDAEQDHSTDGLFWADVDDEGNLTVGDFTGNFSLDDEETLSSEEPDAEFITPDEDEEEGQPENSDSSEAQS
jgi:hypothetical protein